MTKDAVRHITDILTPDAICERVGVSIHSVRYARTNGLFPAGWYRVLKTMCAEAKIACPLDAFNWKVARHTSEDAA